MVKHRCGRHLLLSLFFLASLAKAETITQFTGTYSLDFSMEVAGVDGQGDSLDLVLEPLYVGSGLCPCFGGQAIDVQFNGLVGSTTVNGVPYNGVEVIYLTITGVMPPITMPAGWQGDVTFPITLDIEAIYYSSALASDIQFAWVASGTGTASAFLSILDDANGDPTYQNLGGFTFASDVPEVPSGWLAGLGLAFFAVLTRANKRLRLS